MGKSNIKHPVKNGFTLLELCLAITIFAAIMGTLYGTYRQAMAGWKEGAAAQESDQIARSCLERMAKEVRSAYVTTNIPEIRFIGTNNIFYGMDADRLNFITASQIPKTEKDVRSDLCEVSYFIDNDNATTARWLQRRIDLVPDKDVSSGGRTSLLGRYIVGLNFRYFDGGSWKDLWDSNRELPLAVEITLTIKVDQKKSSYSLVTPVYVNQLETR